MTARLTLFMFALVAGCAAPTLLAPAPTAAPSATATAMPSPAPTITAMPFPGLRLPPTVTELAKGFGGPDDLARMPDGTILFSGVGNGTINQIERDGNVTTLLRGRQEPEEIVVLPAGALIIAEQGKDRLVYFRPRSGQPATTWPQLENKTGKPGVDGTRRDQSQSPGHPRGCSWQSDRRRVWPQPDCANCDSSSQDFAPARWVTCANRKFVL